MYLIRSGDLEPPIDAALTAGAGPADLTGATVLAKARKRGSATLLFSRAPTIVSAPAGTVRVEWLAGETDAPGIYMLEFEVTRGGRKQTFPAHGPLEFRIVPDLDHGLSP